MARFSAEVEKGWFALTEKCRSEHYENGRPQRSITRTLNHVGKTLLQENIALKAELESLKNGR